MRLTWSKLSFLLFGILVISLTCCSKQSYQPYYSWSDIEIDSTIQRSVAIEEIITPYRIQLDSIMDEVIGHAVHELNASREYESTLGTFVTKLLLDQSIAAYDTHVDVALMNHKGGLRAPINKGDITLGDVFQVMPFENEMVLIDLTGDQLLEVIDKVANGGRSMIWPINYHATPEGPKEITLNGEAIKSDGKYVLTVSDYMANGGSGFDMLTDLPRQDIEAVHLRDMIISEIRELTAAGKRVQQDIMNTITIQTP